MLKIMFLNDLQLHLKLLKFSKPEKTLRGDNPPGVIWGGDLSGRNPGPCMVDISILVQDVWILIIE
jgi:hypothetical protein